MKRNRKYYLSQKKKQSKAIDPKMTQMLGLVNNDFNATFIILFKNLKEKIVTMNFKMENLRGEIEKKILNQKFSN